MVTTRTFSISKVLVQALENEARSRGISTSALMNQTLDRAVRQTWPSEKVFVTVIPHYMINGLLGEMSTEGLRKVAESSAKQYKSMASLYGTKRSLESVLEMMDKITGPYFGWFVYTHSAEGRDHRILLTHTIGKKWSVWLEAYFVTLFMEMLEIPLKSSITDNGVMLEFRE